MYGKAQTVDQQVAALYQYIKLVCVVLNCYMAHMILCKHEHADIHGRLELNSIPSYNFTRDTF